jgi:hypothetical protein
MNSTKIWILVTGLLAMLCGFVFYSTIRSKEAEKASLLTKIQTLNGQVEELSKIRAEFEKLKIEKAELEAKLQADMAALETQSDEDKKTETSLRSKLDVLTKDKEALSKYVDENSALVAKLQKKIDLLEKNKLEQSKKEALEKEKAKSSPAEPRVQSPTQEVSPTEKKEIGARFLEEESVDLGQIIIRQTTNQPAAVEHVNAFYGFIVLSAGTEDGLRKDSIVNVMRDNRLIAKAVVKKIRNNTASAATLPEWTREEIRVGDIISVNTLTR